MQVEFVLLVLSLLFFASIFADRISYKFGVPALLMFLAVGMLFGPDGIGTWVGSDGIGYMINISSAQAISTIALCVILFTGGMDTKISDIQPVLPQGIMLATVGVLLTCLITGFFIWLFTGIVRIGYPISIGAALLIAATMSSTDSASVFSILRTNGIKLKHNLRPLLELESGANDPMAYILTISLIGVVTSSAEVSALAIVQDILVQLVMGAVMGFVFGKVVVWLLKRTWLSNESLYPIMVLTACIFIFAMTYFLKGNPYLAVYIGGLIIGNNRFTKKRQTKSFFDGLTWLSQLVMFLMLGLMVRPADLLNWHVWLLCVIISLLLMFVSRPLSVVISMFPWRKQYKVSDRLMVSWVGLRGAVPIIFAILCEANDVPHADMIFNVVFACTIVSLLAQGTTLSYMARRLHLAKPQEPEHRLKWFDIDLPEEVETSAREREVTPELLKKGNCLKDIDVPPHTLVIMARRGDTFFVPTGDTPLLVGDLLLVISDNNAQQVVQDLEDEEDEILNYWWRRMIHHTGAFVKEKWNRLKDGGRMKN